MARKGENIYKRKDGRWEARYEKGRNSKGQIIYGSLYGKSYREVKEKKINSIVKLPVTKTISPSESLNICDISTRWLESIRHTVKESTYSCYLTLIQKHILTYFNNNLIITSEHIQQFINYKITNDLSPASVRNIVVLLERILRYGEDENLLPVTKRSFTFPKSSFYINDTLDASQLSILARYLYLEGDAFSVGLLLCMHTGIRIGELCGLKGGDFNFTNETFEIHRTISRIRNTESTPEHAFVKKQEIPNLEVIVKVKNINMGNSRELFEKCRPMRDYMIFVDKVRRYSREQPLEDAVERTIRECMEEDVMADFLKRNRAEGINS